MSHSFHTTRWTLISQLRNSDNSSGADRALAQLCQRYWFPLYAFARRYGASPADAEDQTQGFFQHLLERSLMSQAQRDRGQFRSYLLGCLKHFLSNEWRKANRQQRGSQYTLVAWDALDAEQRYQLEGEAINSVSEDTVYDQQWAQAVLAEAVRRLAVTYEADGEAERFALLRPTLTGEGDRESMKHALGLTEGALKVAVHRLRKHYRECLREVVAETVSDDGEVEAELAHLVACLRG